ncbi:YfhE family protein [Ornithinibacillus sp. BX22]|uniref:YfhE family protein n=2 Tax=Ornithinibacillus TaxID=484508 RepID=A0A923L445_9BACI|nr:MULTISPECIES: YfhE family protein [Ornithinibacillus]MBC5636135.1 YfhE family protein [Ornithinibacillus hominis]MBS3680975.1 YfhE family protein [Ornithinibacillus massiliensis]
MSAREKREVRDKFLNKTQEVLYQKEFKRADRARQRGDRS